METINSIQVIKRYKIDVAEVACECCGRKIKNIEVLKTGQLVGSECSGLIEWPVYRMGRKLNKRQAAFFQNAGLKF